MLQNIRISNVSGDGPTYTVRASDGESDLPEREHQYKGNRVYIEGIEVTTGTSIGLPGEGFAIHARDDEVHISR